MINLPSLREREGDCLQLAEHFIERFNNDYDLSVLGLTDAAKEFLLSYTWPGNIRQLKNTLERAVLVESDKWVDLKDLQIDSLWSDDRLGIDKNMEKENVVNVIPASNSLEETERLAIANALEQANGNISGAARLLKINRGKLRYKMSRLGVSAFA